MLTKARGATLTTAEIEQYRELGYLVVPDVFDAGLLAEIRRTVDAIIADAGKVTTHTDVYDLEESHTQQAPRVRRIKTPHKHFPFFAELTRNPRITSILAQLIGENIRLHGAKLNMKSAGYGAAVEWHQDWAFYPHTNDDVLATGLYLDDCDSDNGPLMVLPGTHLGPTYDHHAAGRFCGAMNPADCALDFAQSVPLMGPAGSMTIHHARLVHGSALNRSNRQRRLLLHEYTAADAWPLLGVASFDEFNSRMVLGEPTIEPRVVPAPVRMPLPAADHQGSIYENQRGTGRRFFETYEERVRAG